MKKNVVFAVQPPAEKGAAAGLDLAFCRVRALHGDQFAGLLAQFQHGREAPRGRREGARLEDRLVLRRDLRWRVVRVV
jgi:hypothetical protein